VLAVHPNQVAAARDRFRAAAGKSDRFDAFVICELCRTDYHRFAALAPSGDETIALQALVRTREDLVAVRVHLANHVHPGTARARAVPGSPLIRRPRPARASPPATGARQALRSCQRVDGCLVRLRDDATLLVPSSGHRDRPSLRLSEAAAGWRRVVG
jgi:transposase